MVQDYHFNPEDESIQNGKLEFAVDNVKHLLTDVGLDDVRFARDEKEDDRGCFGFVIWKENHAYPIKMPGSPLSLTRHMPPENRTPLERPLDIGNYFGGWSWWNHAVGEIRDELEGNGYNPVIDDLETDVNILKEENEELKKQIDILRKNES